MHKFFLFLAFFSISGSCQASTLEEKIASLILVADYGDEMQAQADGKASVQEVTARVNRLLQEKNIGGVFFQGRWTPSGLKNRISYLNATKKTPHPLIFAQDQEWGLSMRHDGVVELPKALCMGAIVEKDAYTQWANGIAEGAKSVGINLLLGPVADVNTSPHNPVIHDRSFGSDPHRVSQNVQTVVQAFSQAEIPCCAKHFPGHGNTTKDSHISLPATMSTKDKLDTCELLPFRAAIEAGIPCIMTGHIALPNTKSGSEPASLSRYWVTDVLRNELGFDGVCITDDLIMGALSQKSVPEAAVQALQAGNDLLLIARDVDACIEAIAAAVKNGDIQEADIDRHCARVAKLYTPYCTQNLHLEKLICLQSKLYSKAATLVGQPIVVNPSTTLLVQIGSTPLCHTARSLLVAHPELDIAWMRKDPRAEDTLGILDALHGKTEALIILNDTDRTPGTSFGLTPEVLQALHRIHASGQHVRYIIFGSPYILYYLPKNYASALVFYENTDAAQQAAENILFKKNTPQGVLPITL